MNSKRNNIRITERNSGNDTGQQLNAREKFERFKMPLIYFLLAVVCTGCLYLIFKPKKEDADSESAGFNTTVPQAAADKLQSDKQKAYEQQLLQQQDEEKRNALTALSDYWTDGNSSNSLNAQSSVTGSSMKIMEADQNAMGSYRNAHQTLGNFYSRDHTEVENLKREISRLRNEAVQSQGAQKGTTIEDQLELMEKSYQMAAKYLPGSSEQSVPQTKQSVSADQKESKVEVTAVKRPQKNIVSALYRESSEDALLRGFNNKFISIDNRRNFNDTHRRNSIRAVIHETHLVTPESVVAVRLSEPIMVGQLKIPEGTLLKASCKFQGGRLQMKISGIEWNGSVQPVDINIHDNDGQLGLNIPYTQEQHAIHDIVGNMSQSGGTNIMMTQSAGQQIASDLTRGVVQGISGYFQKKVRMPKVTVKAGHQILLVAKNSITQ